jgi:hypothetical protein
MRHSSNRGYFCRQGGFKNPLKLFSDISAEERVYRKHLFVNTGRVSGKERTLKVLPNEKIGGL